MRKRCAYFLARVGRNCLRTAKDGELYCYQHKGKCDPVLPVTIPVPTKPIVSKKDITLTGFIDVDLLVLEYLDLEDLVALSRVSSGIYKLTRDSRVWSKRVEKYNVELFNENKEKSVDWYQLFRSSFLTLSDLDKVIIDSFHGFQKGTTKYQIDTFRASFYPFLKRFLRALNINQVKFPTEKLEVRRFPHRLEIRGIHELREASKREVLLTIVDVMFNMIHRDDTSPDDVILHPNCIEKLTFLQPFLTWVMPPSVRFEDISKFGMPRILTRRNIRGIISNVLRTICINIAAEYVCGRPHQRRIHQIMKEAGVLEKENHVLEFQSYVVKKILTKLDLKREIYVETILEEADKLGFLSLVSGYVSRYR